jgi:hypothetical protein
MGERRGRTNEVENENGRVQLWKMASKPLIIASLLGASIGVPYFAARSKSGNSAATTPPLNANATATVAAPPLLGASASTPTTSTPTTTTVNPFPRSPSAEQALQFNVTKEWVYRSFDRKSTGPTDLGLFAVRVPLVSGTQSASLAGSLTYYFNTQNQVEHISFRGRTGDPSRLVRFLMRQYQFQPLSSQPGEQIYRVSDSGGVRSELRTRPEAIVATATSQGAHSVELELARPGSQRYLPPRGPFISIPQMPDAARPAQTPSSTADTLSSAAASTGASVKGYLGSGRYATSQEEGEANLMRWPD